jgi:hypothetical protein
MLEIKLILEARLEEDDKRYFKEILSEPGSMNDKLQMLPELKSTQVTAEGDDLEDVIYVPEHAYGVFKADNDVVVKAGTTDIYSCIGVVLVNRKDSSFGVTHLDHSTIKQYESSLHDMFELLNARNDTVDVYIQANLTGGDHPTVIK